MVYQINSRNILFTQYADNLWGLTSQDHDVFRNVKCGKKCCKTKISNKQFGSEIKLPISIKYKDQCFCCQRVTTKTDLIIFYLDKKPNDPLYVPIPNVTLCINNSDKKINKIKASTFEVLKIPVSNTSSGSDYSLPVTIGGQTVSLLIDTGSSTIGVPFNNVTPNDINGNSLPTYTPGSSSSATNDQQFVQYGTGGLAGPVLQDTIVFTEPGEPYSNTMSGQFCLGCYAPSTQSPLCTGGIIGVAFTPLNNGSIGTSPTYPSVSNQYSCCECLLCSGTCSQTTTNYWNNLNQSNNYPTILDDIGTNYGSFAQKFALYATRTYYNYSGSNLGYFIMGGGEEYTNFYSGSLATIPLMPVGGVVSYYQVNLIQITWNLGTKVYAVQMPVIGPNDSPSIIDSGTSELSIIIPDSFYNGLVNYYVNLGITDVNITAANFSSIFNSSTVYTLNTVTYSQWPNITFSMTGSGGQTNSFTVGPQNYWQSNYNSTGSFGLALGIQNVSGSGQNAQAIMGLPFICQNYCVFDYANQLVKIAVRL